MEKPGRRVVIFTPEEGWIEQNQALKNGFGMRCPGLGA